MVIVINKRQEISIILEKTILSIEDALSVVEKRKITLIDYKMQDRLEKYFILHDRNGG